MIETDEERLAFFDAEEFGDTVHVAPDAGGGYDMDVIFDAKPVDTRNFQNRFPAHQGAQPSGSSPRFRCLAADFPKDLAGRCTVTIRELDYSVFDVEHDGTGFALVTVKRKTPA